MNNKELKIIKAIIAICSVLLLVGACTSRIALGMYLLCACGVVLEGVIIRVAVKYATPLFPSRKKFIWLDVIGVVLFVLVALKDALFGFGNALSAMTLVVCFLALIDAINAKEWLEPLLRSREN